MTITAELFRRRHPFWWCLWKRVYLRSGL